MLWVLFGQRGHKSKTVHKDFRLNLKDDKTQVM